MSVTEIPTEILGKSLLAVQDFRRKYMGEPLLTYPDVEPKGSFDAASKCPLCQFNRAEYNGLCDSLNGDEDVDPTESLHGCPWWWFEGKVCMGTYKRHDIIERLTRIDRWESAINEELTTRG